MPAARSGTAAISVSSTIYLVGGADFDGNTLRANQAYDTLTNTWTHEAPLPVGREFHGPQHTLVDGRFYIIGGRAGNGSGLCSSENDEYDPVTNHWAHRASSRIGRCDQATIAVGLKLFEMGGTDTTGNLLSDVDMYTPRGNFWGIRGSMPAPRASFAAAEIGGLIYVAGGIGGNGPTASADVYNPKTDTWSAIADMPAAANVAGSAALGGRLYVVAGSINGVRSNKVQVYDPLTNTWSTQTPYPEAVLEPACASSGFMFCFGGATNRAVIRMTESFNPGGR